MRNARIALAVAAVMMMVGGSTVSTAAEEATKAPEKGTWEYAYELETGKLEPVGTGTLKAGDAAPVEETVEIGLSTFRVGIDLQ